MRNRILGAIILLLSLGIARAQPPGSMRPIDPLAEAIQQLRIDQVVTGGPGSAWDPFPGCTFWVSGEYLLFWFHDSPMPAVLVTSDLTNGSARAAGGLANPSTFPLIGGDDVNFGAFSGGRFQSGIGLAGGLGFEGGFFFLGRQSKNFQAASTSDTRLFLFRPFVDVQTDDPNGGSVVARLPATSGQVKVGLTSRVWGTDLRITSPCYQDEDLLLTGLVGFRYLDLVERLAISDVRTDRRGTGTFGGIDTVAGDQVVLSDNFRTRNQFYGAQLGARGEIRCGSLMLAGTARASLGRTRKTIEVYGSSALLPARGAGSVLPGGVLALPSNSGKYHVEDFSVVPEVICQLVYKVTPGIRFGLGYDFLYWGQVARPGHLVPTRVDSIQLPTSAAYDPERPVPEDRSRRVTDFWMHGLNVNLVFSY